LAARNATGPGSFQVARRVVTEAEVTLEPNARRFWDSLGAIPSGQENRYP
jgi:hypothetical protein